MISRTATHALRAMVILADQPPDAFAGAAAIARIIQAPQNYLGKLLQQLAREGLVDSQKGHGGGFRLARPPAKISLYDVVDPIDQVSQRQGCFLGNLLCSEDTACAVHGDWSEVLGAYLNFLQNTTLADVTAGQSGIGAARNRRTGKKKTKRKRRASA